MKLNVAVLLPQLSSVSFKSFLFAQTISKEELIFLTSDGGLITMVKNFSNYNCKF